MAAVKRLLVLQSMLLLFLFLGVAVPYIYSHAYGLHVSLVLMFGLESGTIVQLYYTEQLAAIKCEVAALNYLTEELLVGLTTAEIFGVLFWFSRFGILDLQQ